MTIQRINRDRRLTPEEAAKYREVREQVAEELPDLVKRHHERLAVVEKLKDLLEQLKAAREQQGLSLADVGRLTGLDEASLLELETGQRPDASVDSLARYAEAVGKRLVVSLAEE
jgi:hypothetical protein